MIKITTLYIYTNPKLIHKEWQVILGLHVVFVPLHGGLQLVLSKTNSIGDTKYHI